MNIDIKELMLFKKRFNLSDNFMEIVYSLFDRLVHFEYVSKSVANKLIHKLSANVNEIFIGTKNIYDYKTGFYDSITKTLYIKDENDISAIYLRLLYAITTTEVDSKNFTTGYSKTKMRTDSYKLEYVNYGINRAAVANLVCKLCDTLPISIDIIPTYKTYTHDFLGYEITSNNDIYALEGKILSELCFVFELDENMFYSGIFVTNPIKYLNNIFNKGKFENSDTFLKLLDNISINYSKYNKLMYLSKKINDNYLEIKKNILNDSVKMLKKEKKEIEFEIRNVTNKVSNIELYFDSSDDEYRTDLGLAEIIDDLESVLKKKIKTLQNILVKHLLNKPSSLNAYKYASKLVQFNSMLIHPSDDIYKKVMKIIFNELIPTDEIKAINIIQKIRCALILDLLSTDKFSKISSSFSFYRVEDLTDELNGTTLVILTANKMFAKIAEIRGLNVKANYENLSTKYLPLDNLKYVINSDFSNTYVDDVEKLYTQVRNEFAIFKNVALENMYLFKYNSKNYLIIYKDTTAYVVQVDVKNKEYILTNLFVSDPFKIFKLNKGYKEKTISNLPVILKKNK